MAADIWAGAFTSDLAASILESIIPFGVAVTLGMALYYVGKMAIAEITDRRSIAEKQEDWEYAAFDNDSRDLDFFERERL